MNNLTLAAQQIKDTVSAHEAGIAMGLEIRHGRCQCPFHNGKDFNCVLYKGNRGWYCHVCKSGGDVISFVRQYYSMTFKDCVAWFSDTFHMGLDIERDISPAEKRRAEIALKMRKNAIETQQWKERRQFDLALLAEDIVDRLEKARDNKRPHAYSEEWNPDFCMAVLTLPEAREFAEECMMNCMKEVSE